MVNLAEVNARDESEGVTLEEAVALYIAEGYDHVPVWKGTIAAISGIGDGCTRSGCGCTITMHYLLGALRVRGTGVDAPTLIAALTEKMMH